MAQFCRQAVVVLAVLLGFSNAPATLFYVDKDASGGNDGTSWVNAWTSFAGIGWSVVQPGDTIYISGGTTSKEYYETMDVTASGSEGLPITVTKGVDAGHSGDVIINGQGARSNGIFIRAERYLVVSNLQIRGHTDPEVQIRGQSGSTYDPASAAKYVTVDNMDLYVTGRAGVHVQTSDNIVITNCRISTPAYVATQTDGIYSQRNHDNTYERNRIVISNDHADGHDDGIQMFQDTSTTIRYNYIEQDNTKESNAQGVYITESNGTFEAYGNVVYGPNTKNGLLTLRNIDTAAADAKLIAYHNTLVGGGWGTLIIDDAPESIVKNNILMSYKADIAVIRLYPDAVQPPPENIDYNLYYLPNSPWVAMYESGNRTFSEWQALGYDAHGVYDEDPLFENVGSRDFRLQDGSPGVDAGAVLAPPYDQDQNGVSRPQGSGWDIGAFERPSGPDNVPPAAPTNLTVTPP